MKRTLSVNIGSVAFTIDEDAYGTLKSYFDDISSRLYDSDKKEIMEDIESRTADIFTEGLSFPSQVISMDMVKKAIARIGHPSTFGEKKYDPDYLGGKDETTSRTRLYRSRNDRILGGVCGGLAEYFNIDSTVMRLITLCLLIFGGFGFIVYIILWIVVPEEPRRDLFTAGGLRNKWRNRS